MSNQEVEYLAHMGDDLMVANCARVSHGKLSTWADDQPGNLRLGDQRIIEYLATGMTRADRENLIDELMSCRNRVHASDMIDRIQNIVKHWSPFSHPQVQFRIKAPIFVARQLLRSQVGLSVNEVSRRYVDDEPEFFLPDEWRSRPDATVKQGSGGRLSPELHGSMEADWSATVGRSLLVYGRMIKDGAAPEQARMLLPQGMMTEWVWTGSLMAWARICIQRLDPHAQAESAEIAKQISVVMKDLFPYSWKALLRLKD